MSKRLPPLSAMMREPPAFTKGSSRRISYLGNISSIQAMSMPGCCTAESRDFGIDLVGPTRPDVKWQAQEKKGFAAGQFQIDWQAEQATCPRSVTRVSVGLQPSTIATPRSSRSSSPSKIVKAVPVVACVRALRAIPVVPSPCVGSGSITPYNRHGFVPRPTSSKRSLPVVLG